MQKQCPLHAFQKEYKKTRTGAMLAFAFAQVSDSRKVASSTPCSL